MKLRVVSANELRMTCYTQGSGESLVVLAHGFPDDAATFVPLMERLAAPELTLVAPYMRGYGPTSRAPDGRYFPADLGRDLLGVLDAFEAQQAVLIGHDWGALAAYAAAGLAPERVRAVVALSVPPVPVLLANLRRAPHQLVRSWYMFLFQLGGLSELVMQAGDQALIDALWRAWSPGWRYPAPRLAKVKSTLARQGTTRAALQYYRALGVGGVIEPSRWRESYEVLTRPLTCPTLLITGRRDRCIGHRMFHHPERAVVEGAPIQLRVIEGCGHFPQHEALDTVSAEITELLRGLPR